ncbi:hypothetical protein OROMI_005246 [Orobanche minor]
MEFYQKSTLLRAGSKVGRAVHSRLRSDPTPFRPPPPALLRIAGRSLPIDDSGP